jgi:hypothetical protein
MRTSEAEMTNIIKLHNDSMDAAELAFLARMNRDYEKSEELFGESLKLELKAIDEIEKTNKIEPTYSVLLRSAATLALDCNDPRLAEKLVCKALSSNPPEDIVEELRDLMEQVNFRRHLITRGIVLEEDELQLSLAGEGVGLGVVDSQEFLQRVDNVSKLIFRIAERRKCLPFREKGRPKKSISEDLEVFLSVPRAASFAVTLKLGRPKTQTKLPEISNPSEIVDEFLDLMNLINRAEVNKIESQISDEAYRTNFIHLAKRIMPDGKKIKLVGFTSRRKGQDNFLEVVQPKSNFETLTISKAHYINEIERVQVKGILRFADATHGEKGQIRIVDESTHKTINVIVPQGMMNDIVKPLWDSNVIITGKKEDQNIILEDIEEQMT